MKVLIVGGGNMGSCFVKAWQTHHDLQILEGSPERAFEVQEKLGIPVTHLKEEAVKWCEVMVICLKPYVVQPFLKSCGGFGRRLIISIAAGVKQESLFDWAQTQNAVRVMPNTPCQVSKGMTVILKHAQLTADHLKLTQDLFNAVGQTVTIDNEAHMDAITAVCGSGPAFLCLVLEAMTDGAVKMGLPRDLSLQLACQTMLGTAAMIQETKQHPAVLREAVTTPAGCTIAGLARMEEGAVRHWVSQAIQAATESLKK